MIPGTFKFILEPLPAPCITFCQLIQVHFPLYCTHRYYCLGNIMDLLSVRKSRIVGIVPIIQCSPFDRDTERGIAFMRPFCVLLTGIHQDFKAVQDFFLFKNIHNDQSNGSASLEPSGILIKSSVEGAAAAAGRLANNLSSGSL